MAATALSTTPLKSVRYGEVGAGLAFSTIDGTDGGTWVNTGCEAIIVRNNEAATNTIQFVRADGTTDAALTIPASKCVAYGPLDAEVYGTNPVIKTADAVNITVLVVDVTGGDQTITA